MSGTKKEIVVVEDDAGMREALRRLLDAAGFDTKTFPTAEDLLEAHAGGSAACFVLDIHLPGLSGFDLSRRLAESGAPGSVIFITANDGTEARAEAKDLGAAAFFAKPFNGAKFLDAVTLATARA